MRKNRLLVNGCFDGLHVGHIHLITTAREKCAADYVFVALNSGHHIMKEKNLVPMFSFKERKEHLEALRAVDKVVNCGTNPLLAFRVFVHLNAQDNWNWARTEGSTFLPDEEQFIKTWNVNIVWVPELEGFRSSTLYDRKISGLKAISQ